MNFEMKYVKDKNANKVIDVLQDLGFGVGRGDVAAANKRLKTYEGGKMFTHMQYHVVHALKQAQCYFRDPRFDEMPVSFVSFLSSLTLILFYQNPPTLSLFLFSRVSTTVTSYSKSSFHRSPKSLSPARFAQLIVVYFFTKTHGSAGSTSTTTLQCSRGLCWLNVTLLLN